MFKNAAYAPRDFQRHGFTTPDIYIISIDYCFEGKMYDAIIPSLPVVSRLINRCC